MKLKNHNQDTFKNASTDFHPNFLNALQQINRWRAWFANRSNLDGFINGTLAGLVPQILSQTPCVINYVLVHGRRTEYEGNNLKKGFINGQEKYDFHILSYDSLVESLYSKGELYLAIKKNEYIEILVQPH